MDTQEESIDKCLQMGIKDSTLCLCAQGVAESIPMREEVENFNVSVWHTLYSE